jgi:hypothetical protein
MGWIVWRCKLIIKILVNPAQMSIYTNCKCVPFIHYDPGHGYKIDPLALQYLSTLPEEDNYTVLSIAGKAKTGKSFLLNQLLSD